MNKGKLMKAFHIKFQQILKLWNTSCLFVSVCELGFVVDQ